MKIILLDDIKGLGKKHDAREVADGYARNFLFPNKLARTATTGALKELARLKAAQEEEGVGTRKELEELARLLGERYLEFALRTDKTGAVFGSVTKEMILKAMREHGWVRKERVEVKLTRPIKAIGEHSVSVDLKKGITAELRVVVRPQT